MIHYTVFPSEVIFQDPHHPPERRIREVVINGVSMQIEVLKTGEARILRLLSPDLNHYLDPRFQPGNRVILIPDIR